MRGASGSLKMLKRLVALALVASHTGALAAPALAAPHGASVVAGQATVSTAGALTKVRQHTDRAIINWQGFSTGAGETVRFAQSSATSVVLNRVVTMGPSVLSGALQANGRLFLINPPPGASR